MKKNKHCHKKDSFIQMDKIALSQLTPFKVNTYHFCALENRII